MSVAPARQVEAAGDLGVDEDDLAALAAVDVGVGQVGGRDEDLHPVPGAVGLAVVDDELAEELEGARREAYAGLLLELAVGRGLEVLARARRGRRPGPTSPGRCGGCSSRSCSRIRPRAVDEDDAGEAALRRRPGRTGARRSTPPGAAPRAPVDGTRSRSGSGSGSTKTIWRPSWHSTSRVARASYGRRRRGSGTCRGRGDQLEAARGR